MRNKPHTVEGPYYSSISGASKDSKNFFFLFVTLYELFEKYFCK